MRISDIVYTIESQISSVKWSFQSHVLGLGNAHVFLKYASFPNDKTQD